MGVNWPLPAAVEIPEDEAFAPTWSRKDDLRGARQAGNEQPPTITTAAPNRRSTICRRTGAACQLAHCGTVSIIRGASNAGKATCDALLYELRTYGAAQLAKPNCQCRLTELSTPQLRELIAALTRLKPNCRAIDDTLLLKLGKLL
jgi:hypothetical protein